MPRSCVSCLSAPRIVARSEASTIDTGSSARITRGRKSSARATMTRWRCPPESWCGNRPRVSSGRSPTARRALLDQGPGLGPRGGQPEPGDGHRQHVVDAVEGVVDLVGVLEDRLDLAPEAPPLPRATSPRGPAPVGDVAAGRRQQAEEQAGERRLAAAALADDGGDGRAALAEGEREVPEGDGVRPVEQPAAEDLVTAAGLEERRHARAYARWHAAQASGRASRSAGSPCGSARRPAGSGDGTRSRGAGRGAAAGARGCPGTRPSARARAGWR